MSRSKWKGPYINRYKYYENNLLNKNITITPINLNSLLNIHNGFKKIKRDTIWPETYKKPGR